MPRTSIFPAYSVSDVPSLAGPPANSVQYEFGGQTIAVTNDGMVYTDDGYGNWTVNQQLSAVLRQVDANVPGAVNEANSNSGFNFDGFLENLTGLVGVVLQGKAQHDLLQMNLERAKTGLPPINAQQYMPGVNIGMDQGTKNTLLAIAGIAAAAFVLPSFLGGGGRRRR